MIERAVRNLRLATPIELATVIVGGGALLLAAAFPLTTSGTGSSLSAARSLQVLASQVGTGRAGSVAAAIGVGVLSSGLALALALLLSVRNRRRVWLTFAIFDLVVVAAIAWLAIRTAPPGPAVVLMFFGTSIVCGGELLARRNHGSNEAVTCALSDPGTDE